MILSMFKKTIIILLCLMLFIMYVFFDNYREPFDAKLAGRPNDNETAPLAYFTKAKELKDPKNNMDENEYDVFLNHFTNEEDIKEYTVKVNAPNLERHYSLSEIERDLQYFNNASHIADAMGDNIDLPSIYNAV